MRFPPFSKEPSIPWILDILRCGSNFRHQSLHWNTTNQYLRRDGAPIHEVCWSRGTGRYGCSGAVGSPTNLLNQLDFETKTFSPLSFPLIRNFDRALNYLRNNNSIPTSFCREQPSKWKCSTERLNEPQARQCRAIENWLAYKNNIASPMPSIRSLGYGCSG